MTHAYCVSISLLANKLHKQNILIRNWSCGVKVIKLLTNAETYRSQGSKVK